MQDFQTMFRMDGRVALVTGAGFGLGRSFALGLAAYGATVIVADRDRPNADETVGLIKQNRGLAEAIHVDVAATDSTDRLFDEIQAKYGRLDILVNNAGITTVPMRTHEVAVEDWDRLMSINLRGVFLCTRRALAMMLPAKSGSIISIASIAGVTGYYPGFSRLVSSYSAAKAGVAGFTRQVAAEYAPDGIRANAIAPGWHGGTNLGAVARAAFTPEQQQQAERAIAERIPLGRRGVPDDLVGLVVYLASDASSYLTGQTITHDGGWTVG